MSDMADVTKFAKAGFNFGVNSAKEFFNTLANQPNDKETRIYVAVVEGGGALALTSAGLLMEKFHMRFFITGFISNTVQRVCYIAALVLAVDMLRRGVPSVFPGPYSTFYSWMPNIVRTILVEPVDVSNDDDINHLPNLEAARKFAHDNFNVDPHADHSLDALKRLINTASAAKKTYDEKSLSYDIVSAAVNDADAQKRLPKKYIELVKANVAYAKALAALSSTNQNSCKLVLVEPDEDSLPFVYMVEQEKKPCVMIGNDSYDCNAIKKQTPQTLAATIANSDK